MAHFWPLRPTLLISALSALSTFSLLTAGCSSANEGDPPDTGMTGGASGNTGGEGSGASGNTGGEGSGASGNTGGEGSGASGNTGGEGSGASGNTGGEGSGGEESAGSEYGFDLRVPAADDLDWLCTFGQSEPAGYVYVRLTQTGEESSGIATVPVYAASVAQVSIDGTVSMLESAAYDHGGGHNNDSLQFDHAGKTYKYYHSSFGFGFRKCQPMDCIDIYDLGAATPETEGCAANRVLPEVCVQIQPDGTHDPLVDTFEKCPGDAN